MNKFNGIVLDGMVKVGSYRYHTSEDAYGHRQIIDLKLNSQYMNEGLSTTNKELQFMIIDEKNKKVVDEIGMGTISGHGLHDGDNLIIDNATFLKSPKSIKYEN
jgi:hypothetical protein